MHAHLLQTRLSWISLQSAVGLKALPPSPAGRRFEWEELQLRVPDEASRREISDTFAALEFVQHARRLDLVWASLSGRSAALAY